MKLYCFSITFFLVNVLATNETQYKRMVAKTNAAIKLAYDTNDLPVGENTQTNGLEYVIEHILKVVVFEATSFAEINLMIAVPDETNLILLVPGEHYLNLPMFAHLKWSALFGIQNNMLREIGYRLSIDLPEAEAEAGQDFRSLKLTTLGEQRRLYVESALKNIFKREFGSMYNQFIFQLEKRDTINVERLNVTTLTENRRVTGTSLENVVTRVLGTGAPESNEAVENQSISKNGPPLLRLCRLMALYMSTKFPTTYIKDLWYNIIDNTCCLDDGNLIRRLKQINGVWWQISSQKQSI